MPSGSFHLHATSKKNNQTHMRNTLYIKLLFSQIFPLIEDAHIKLTFSKNIAADNPDYYLFNIVKCNFLLATINNDFCITFSRRIVCTGKRVRTLCARVNVQLGCSQFLKKI